MEKEFTEELLKKYDYLGLLVMRKKSMLIILLTVSVLMPAFAGINYGQCVTEAANLVAGGLKTTSKVAFVSMDSDSDSFSRKFISDVESTCQPGLHRPGQKQHGCNDKGAGVPDQRHG